MKTKFEKEIADWKIQLSEAQNIIAQLKLQLENLQQDGQRDIGHSDSLSC